MLSQAPSLSLSFSFTILTDLINFLQSAFVFFFLFMTLQAGLKPNSIKSDYYFDMEYCVEYSTFQTLRNRKCSCIMYISAYELSIGNGYSCFLFIFSSKTDATVFYQFYSLYIRS